MSYLTQYAVRPDAALRTARRGARVNVDVLLNRPSFDGGAAVHAFVQDTSRHPFGRRRLPKPRLELRVSDCINEINLEFSVSSYELRENSLHKIDTLIDALAQFRAGLAAEAELRARRERR
jgi:hypothetical protein